MTNLKTIESAAAIEIPDYKLFSGTQILIGTIFGSLITGQVMLALNYAKIKDYEDANRKMLFGTVYFPLFLMTPGINLITVLCLSIHILNLRKVSLKLLKNI